MINDLNILIFFLNHGRKKHKLNFDFTFYFELNSIANIVFDIIRASTKVNGTFYLLFAQLILFAMIYNIELKLNNCMRWHATVNNNKKKKKKKMKKKTKSILYGHSQIQSPIYISASN